MEVGKSMGLIYGFVNDGFYTVDDFNFDETTKKWTLKPEFRIILHSAQVTLALNRER